MHDLGPTLVTFFLGSFFGTLLGPLLLDECRYWLRRIRWDRPRKKLLENKLISAGGEGWVRLSKLMILTGTSADECRSLLIQVDARGGLLNKRPQDQTDTDREGWALISRQPLTKSGEDVAEVE